MEKESEGGIVDWSDIELQGKRQSGMKCLVGLIPAYEERAYIVETYVGGCLSRCTPQHCVSTYILYSYMYGGTAANELAL